LLEKTEEFDPSILTIDVIEQHVPKILNAIQEFRGDDEGFASMLKDSVTNFVTVLVIELEDGFGNFADVQTFVKSNLT